MCKGCPQNSWWDVPSSQCVGCPAGFIAVNKTCTCPANTPYLDANSKCVSCSLPSWWDESSKQCKSCPASYTYSQSENKCVCPQNAPYVTANNICTSCNAPGIWDT